jgi:anti-anti-sigma factor
VTSEALSISEVTVSVTVAFPDFSAGRERGVGRAFVCTLQAGDVGPSWVRVAGDLDLSSAPRLAQALRHADAPPRLVVLDLRELRSIDSCGVHVIVDASAQARRARRRLILIRGPSQVDRVLALAGAHDVLEIVDLDPPEPRGRALGQLALPDDAA